MNLPRPSLPVVVILLVVGLAILGLSFVVDGATFGWLALGIGIAGGMLIAAISGRNEESGKSNRR